MLPWQYAMAAACGLVIVAAVIRGRLAARSARHGESWALWGGVAWESALLFLLYGLWQFAGSFTVMSPAGALPRGRWLWHAERVLHMPSETVLQRAFLPHPLIVQALNLYYAGLHFVVVIACLIAVLVLALQGYAGYAAVTGAVAISTGIPLSVPFTPLTSEIR